MTSTTTRNFTNLEAFWEDDFSPLEDAGKEILSAMREDEAAPDADLYRRINATGPGSHRYFSSEASSLSEPPPTVTWNHARSVPLPPFLAQQLKSVKSHTLMGLLSQAELAWLSIDDKLFLWPYAGPTNSIHGPSFCSFTIPNGQCVLSVGLVHPKRGVFKPSVKWCLVVTTHEEVILCALVQNDDSNGTISNGTGFRNTNSGMLRLVPTSFTVPTDYVRMLCVCSTKDGRIFLGGEDGCVYEMSYEGAEESSESSKRHASVEESLELFYDHGKATPSVLQEETSSVTDMIIGTGKRAISSVVFGHPSNGASYRRPRKCRKLNHSPHVPALASAVFPDFVLKATSYILGSGKAGGGKIIKMLVDEERSCLYTLSSRGWIGSFDLTNGEKMKLKQVAAVDITKTARLYLEAVSRGQMLPPSSYSPTIGMIIFPGGGVPAQAGVGGMEGARSILKLADFSVKRNNLAKDNILMPISIHVISRKESSRLTLVAITKGGLRYYISSLAESVISSGPSHHFKNSRKRNPLAPSGRISLCHIRAPPPVMEIGNTEYPEIIDSETGVGGYAPKIAASRDKILQVDGSFYHQSHFVLAIEQRGTTFLRDSESSRLQSDGDIIVSSAPDSVARKKEVREGDLAGTNTSFSAPGGISENISFPMATAYGSSERVPGGMVWDIAQVTSDSSILNLALSSQTPTESELGVGLVPAYFPASKVPSRDIKRIHGSSDSSSPSTQREIASSKDISLSSVAMKVMINIASNVILSRPDHVRLPFQSLSQKPKDTAIQTNYRISARYGYNGFSLTAADTSSRDNKSGMNKSARLSSWLLKPAVVPLNPLAIQHLIPSNQIVTLNAGGLQYFECATILSRLADTLMNAGANVDSDKHVTSYFKSYGHVEACAMCLLIAIGFGSDGGNDTLTTLASRAALARAFVPKLLPLSQRTSGSNTSLVVNDSFAAMDPLLPDDYEFCPSALSKGLTAVISRLLRPIWHKPAVVVTEGRTVRHGWTASSLTTPAKVEALLDDATLEQIRKPLYNLQMLMKDMFSPAVVVTPGMRKKPKNMMDIDDEGQDHYLTRALSYHSHQRNGTGVTTGQLAPSEAESIAHITEERKIHSQYRLLSRTVQLLTLLSILKRTHHMQELPEVEWGLLHGLTFSQLVQTRDGQDRLESLLNSLVTSTAATANKFVAPSAEADQLASQFAEHCYLYFSPGSRFAYLGFRHANQALTHALGSARRADFAKQAVECFRQASKHWHSAPLITGRLLHMKEKEEYETIALRAMRFDSPLAKATNVLIMLGEVAGVVEICLITASNFGAKFEFDPLLDHERLEKLSNRMFIWEQDLYHKRRETSGDAQSLGVTSSTSPSASNTVALGTAVTSKDAIETCHAMVFHHLSTLLNSNEIESAERMVSACAAVSDNFFLRAFFLHLYQNEHIDTLLRINSTAVEEWLRDLPNDPHLLYRYYVIQGQHYRAGQVSWERAKQPSLDLSLSERIECLSRSWNSFQASLKETYPLTSHYDISGLQASTADRKALEQTAIVVKETLDVARIQTRVLHAVDSSNSGYDLPSEKYNRLSKSLLPISDLFNDYATEMHMFDICLMIFHACKSYDEAIPRLWHAIFCEVILPCATRDRGAFHFLTSFSRGCLVEEKVKLLKEDSYTDVSMPLFESGEWLKKLENRIATLGRDLYGSGADHVFPVNYIVSNLDSLFRALQECENSNSLTHTGGWPLLVLADVGVPYFTVLEAYEHIKDGNEQEWMGGVNPQRQLDHLSNVVDFLRHWISIARSARAGEAAIEPYEQLTQAVNSRGLITRIDKYRTRLEALPAIGSVSSVLASLQDVQQNILTII